MIDQAFPKTYMHELYGRDNLNGPFVIADIGLTNDGSISTCLELIDAASDLGVDAVKLQMLDADELINNKDVEYTYPTLLKGEITENMVDMFKAIEFTDEEWSLIRKHCDLRNIGLIVTSHVSSAVNRISKLDLPVNKICTWSLSHWTMIRDLAQNGKPLIIDTGTITKSELDELNKFYSNNGGGDLIILFDFHTTDIFDRNFRAIVDLVESDYVVGYTPQGRSDWLDFMSIGLGVSVIEKRLTLSRIHPKNGHWKAHEPTEFSKWLQKIKDCYAALGRKALIPTKYDLESTRNWYKSALLVKNVSKGDIITESDFIFKRPGTGVSSKEIINLWTGKCYSKDYKVGEEFTG